MSLQGRTVVLTGASSGVGRATARAFAERGANLALLSREGEGLERARAEAEAAGARALAIPTDVADFAQVDAAAGRAEAELGPIAVWVNDAMATVFGRVWDLEVHDVQRTTEVIYLGGVHGMLAALERMKPRDEGTIIQVGSALAYRAIPLQAAYCGAKHGLRGFVDSLRCELMAEKSNVHVTSVHLPGLNTPQFTWVRVRGLPNRPRPVAPVYQPEIAAEGIVFAAEHPHRREVWVGGSTVAVILGNKLAPKVADWYLAKTNIQGQQTQTPLPPGYEDYLDTPLPGDRTAHGPFGDEAKGSSLQLRATKHRRALLAAGAGLFAGALATARAR